MDLPKKSQVIRYVTKRKTMSEDTTKGSKIIYHMVGVFIFLSSDVILSTAASDPYFIEEPIDTTATDGDEYVQLNCTIGNKESVTNWYFNGMTISAETVAYDADKHNITGDFESGEYNLVVISVTHDDEGEYTCSVFVAGGSPRAKANLTVQDAVPASFINLKVDTDPVIEHDHITITCSATGAPPPDYEWNLNDKGLPDTNRFKITKEGSVLEIDGILKNETGNYRCEVSNRVGSDSGTILVDVYFEPSGDWPRCLKEFSSQGNDAKAGDLANITCYAEGGNPQPTLTWKNGSTVLTGIDQGTYISSKSYIWTLTPHDNEKTYVCHGEHEATHQEPTCDTGKLDVKYSPTTQTCSKSPDKESYDEGEDLLVRCEADGNPLATLQWINTSSSVVLSETRGPYQGDIAVNEHSLELLRGDNQISFKCDAFNDVDVITIDCETGEMLVYFPALLVSLNGYTSAVKKGDVLELSCVTDSSNPQSVVDWYKNGAIILENEDEKIKEEVISDGSFHGLVTTGGLQIFVLASHNQNTFHCKSTRSEYSDDLESESITTEVFFPASEPDGCKTNLTGYSTALLEGDDLVLTCTSCSSNPQATLEWFRNDQIIDSGLSQILTSPGEFNGLISSQDLTLHLTYQNHDQTYRCEAFNDVFSDTDDRSVSAETVLDIHYAPFIENGDENRRRTVNQTENVDLLCQINSNPVVEITWFDNNNQTVGNDTEKFLKNITRYGTLTHSTLTIVNTTESDFGDYRCNGANYLTDINYTITLTGKTKPEPADNVVITEETEDSLTLKWTPGFDGGLEQQFQLEYIESGLPWDNYRRTNATSNTTDTIYGLVAMTTYYITVISFNAVGESKSHPPTIATTLQKTPTPTSASAGLIITFSLIVVAIIVIVILSVLIWRNYREAKRDKEGHKSSSACNIDSDKAKLETKLLSSHQEQHKDDIDFAYSTQLSNAVTVEETHTTSSMDRKNNTTDVTYSSVKKSKEATKAETYAVVNKMDNSCDGKNNTTSKSRDIVKGEAHRDKSDDSIKEDSQYAVVDVKKKKMKGMNGTDQEVDDNEDMKAVYANVNKKKKWMKWKKVNQQGQQSTLPNAEKATDSYENLPSFVTDGQSPYANAPTIKNLSKTTDNSNSEAYEDVTVKALTPAIKSSNITITMPAEAKNVEGLVYADLDIDKTKPSPGGERPKPPKKPDGDSTAYATIDFSNTKQP